MPGAARLGDRCTGHSCYNPRNNVEASRDVITNDLGAHRQGDAWASHSCRGSSHTGNLAQGSSTVWINDRQAGRIGDPVNCGSKVQTGSDNVIIGP